MLYKKWGIDMKRHKMNARKRQMRRRRGMLVAAILCMIITGGVAFGSLLVDAHNEKTSPATYQYYKSITIQPGDTLWTIAQEYKGTTDTDSYVKEIKQLNGMKNDCLKESQKLMIIYYDTEYRN